MLLIIVLSVGLVPSVFAAETEGNSTDETVPQETKAETNPTEGAVPSEEESIMVMSDDGIATVADYEIVGDPVDFCTLYPEEGIDITFDGNTIHKNHIPLYALYLKNQPGYENNYYVAYCIEPGVFLDYSTDQYGSSFTLDDVKSSSSILDRLTSAKLKAIAIALLYGQREIASKKDAESVRLEKLRHHAATQVIVWEIACGYRSATPPYKRSDSRIIDAVSGKLEIQSVVWNNSFYIDGIEDAYDEILDKMAKHYTIPSFASDQKSMASTYTMTDSGNGSYTITLTDTNKILSEYTFTNTYNITYKVSGNKLTVTVTGEVSSEIVVSATKKIPNLDDQVFYVWENGDEQRLMNCKAEPKDDPVPCYFKLKIDTGGISLIKTTEDGKNLSGWQFGIYSNSSCTKLISGPHTTNSKGKISVEGLSAGTVYIKELGHEDSDIDALYVCTSTNPQKVTIQAGSAATVKFNNDLRTGYGKLIKKTSTGKNLEGWQFNVYTNKACTKLVDGSPFTTDSSGTITAELLPGTYYVKEVEGTDPYWQYDTTVRKVTVVADETASVTFTNIHNGKAKIIKTLENPEAGTVEGWTFEVTDSAGAVVGSYTTDASGEIVCDLEPGEYTITEKLEEDSLWQSVGGESQTVTVKAGETAEVKFSNAIRPAEITIYKVDIQGAPLAGTEFLLEWSDDEGRTWKPVTYTESAYPVIGGCTSAHLVDGKLTTGKDGIAVFTGLYPTLQYRLTETSTPEGYQLLTEPAFEGNIPVEDNLVVELTVVNAPAYELPMTGSTGSRLQTGLQLAGALALLGLLLYIAKKRR